MLMGFMPSFDRASGPLTKNPLRLSTNRRWISLLSINLDTLIYRFSLILFSTYLYMIVQKY